MSRIFITLSAIFLCISAFAQEISESKVIPFADPFILYEDGLYYLYGTGSDEGIPVVVSKDLKTWSWPEGESMYFALHKDNSFGERMFWAPEVYKVDGRYIMYYSSQERICAAESDSPLGPFVQKVQRPMRRQRGIDNHLFVDRDGNKYIYWVHFNNANEIWMARLQDDATTIVPGTEKLCIKMSQDWEKVWPSVNEGPSVIERDGVYYMTYSANSYESPSYGVGVATSSSPEGPWVKYEGNPILQFYNSLEGVGHHAMFKDAKGKDRIVFHSHNRPGKIHPRIIHIGKFRIRKGKVIISDKFITPQMK
ncbi:MAG: 1,4-beta-xylanase [Bacteroidales bacterium]|nr:1,4-beta-xylanase [Bacteroidales bacterium]